MYSIDTAAAVRLAAILQSEGIDEYTDIGFLEHTPKAKVDAMMGGTRFERNEDVDALLRHAIKDASSSTTGVIEKAAKEIAACMRMPASSSQQVAVGTKRGFTGVPRAAEQLSRDRVACALSITDERVPAIHEGHAPAVPGTLLSQDMAKMVISIDMAWKFFKEMCSGSPRGVELFSDHIPCEEEIGVIRDMIRDGSKSHKAVAQRVRAARRFMTEVSERGWSPWNLTPLQQAAWLKRQSTRGRSCASHGATTIRWMSQLCNFKMHSTRIAFNLRAGTSSLVKERAANALCPSIEMVKGLASQIVDAPSPQLRTFAGLCVLAVENSCGFREANRVRKMYLTDDALVGESRAKNHDSWMPWAAYRIGVCGRDWAKDWLYELSMVGLPGEDFVLNASTRDGCRWLPRVAEHPDANAMLRLLLTLPPHDLSVNEASSFGFHGLKKLYPTLGIQLKAIGAITDERGIERLGHWAKNSSMPDLYNDEQCVAELHTRSIVAKAVLGGWRPAAFGCVPMPVSSSSNAATSSTSSRTLPMAVARKSSKWHFIIEFPKTACGKLDCGINGERGGLTFRKISEVTADAKWCPTCANMFVGGA